jgi:uncharacterized protein (DUF2225 family)
VGKEFEVLVVEKQKCNNVRTVPKSNRKMLEIVKITTHNTQIHDYSLSWLGTAEAW